MFRNDSRTTAVRAAYVLLTAALACLAGAAAVAADEPAPKAPSAGRAEAAVLVVRRSLTEAPPKSGAGDDLAAHVILLRSPLLLQKAIRRGKLDSLKSLTGRDPVAALAAGLTVRRDPDAPASVLLLTFEGGAAGDSVAILTALLDSYRDYLAETYRNVSDDTLELITRGRDTVQRELRDKEADYREFRQKSPLLGQGKDGTSVQQERIAGLEAKKTALQIGQAETRARLDALEKALQGDAETRTAALAKVQEWATRGGFDKLPERLKKETDPAKVYAASLRQEWEDSRATEATLDKLVEVGRQQLRDMAMYGYQDAKYREEIDRAQQLYAAVVKRLQEVNLTRDADGFDLRVLASPHASEPAQQPPAGKKPEAATDADFAGKFVFVQTLKDAATLEQVRVKRLGGQAFIVGRVAKDGFLTRGEFAGSTMWLPLSEVKRLVVMDELKKLRDDAAPPPGR
jgi:hypothetical protein